MCTLYLFLFTYTKVYYRLPLHNHHRQHRKINKSRVPTILLALRLHIVRCHFSVVKHCTVVITCDYSFVLRFCCYPAGILRSSGIPGARCSGVAQPRHWYSFGQCRSLPWCLCCCTRTSRRCTSDPFVCTRRASRNGRLAWPNRRSPSAWRSHSSCYRSLPYH